MPKKSNRAKPKRAAGNKGAAPIPKPRLVARDEPVDTEAACVDRTLEDALAELSK